MSQIPTTVKNKKLVKKRREQIVRAAIELFARKGYHETTLRDLAEEAGISYGNIYDYVGSKEDILFLIHQYLCEIIFEELDIAVEGLTDPLEKLRRMVRAEFNLMDNWANAILLLYQEGRVLKGDFLKSFLSKEHQHVQFFERTINECIQDGQLRECNSRLAANLVKCMVDCWVLKRWDLRGHATRLEAEKAILQVLLNGLLNQQGPGALPETQTDHALTGKQVLVANAGGLLGQAAYSYLSAKNLRLCCHIQGTPREKVVKAAGGHFDLAAMKAHLASGQGPMTPKLLEEIELEQGPIDIYIHDLGVGYLGLEDEIGEKDKLAAALIENLVLARDMAPFLRETMSKKRTGRIIFLAPWAWDRYLCPYRYEIAKAGAVALTNSLSQALAPQRTTVNCIIPGFIQSPRPSTVQKEKREEAELLIPAENLGEIDDVNEAINYLIGDSAKYVTGQVINVSGGLV